MVFKNLAKANEIGIKPDDSAKFMRLAIQAQENIAKIDNLDKGTKMNMDMVIDLIGNTSSDKYLKKKPEQIEGETENGSE